MFFFFFLFRLFPTPTCSGKCLIVTYCLHNQPNVCLKSPEFRSYLFNYHAPSLPPFCNKRPRFNPAMCWCFTVSLSSFVLLYCIFFGVLCPPPPPNVAHGLQKPQSSLFALTCQISSFKGLGKKFTSGQTEMLRATVLPLSLHPSFLTIPPPFPHPGHVTCWVRVCRVTSLGTGSE